MITERTLKQWRRDALTCERDPETSPTMLGGPNVSMDITHYKKINRRILRLTQELMDIYLVKR